jgi:hypothetical protein
MEIVADSITPGGIRLTTIQMVVYTDDYHIVTQPRELVHSLHADAYKAGFVRGGFHKILLTSSSWGLVTDFYMASDLKRQPSLGWDIRKLLQKSKPRRLEHGMWHLPYIDDDDLTAAFEQAVNDVPKGMQLSLAQLVDNGNLLAAKVSAARCMRLEVDPSWPQTSRLVDIRRDLSLYHLAIDGRVTTQLFTEHQFTPDLVEDDRWLNPHLQGPPVGWVMLRPILSWDGWRKRDSGLDTDGAKRAQG